MNALDELLNDTGRVAGLDPAAIHKGRTQIDAAVRSFQAGNASDAPSVIRRWAVGGACAVGVAAAAVVAVGISAHQPGTIHSAATGQGSGTPVATGPTATAKAPVNTIELTGYRLTLPTDYKVGRVDTNCTSDLHLSAAEARRLVTTSAHGCPLLVTSVQSTLPSDASQFSVVQGGDDGTTGASFVGWSSELTNEVYLPTKLPDGTTVYVTIDDSDLAPGQANVYFAGGLHNVAQLEEFEQGVTVTPSSQLPTSTATPANKPTVNCHANCNH